MLVALVSVHLLVVDLLFLLLLLLLLFLLLILLLFMQFVSSSTSLATDSSSSSSAASRLSSSSFCSTCLLLLRVIDIPGHRRGRGVPNDVCNRSAKMTCPLYRVDRIVPLRSRVLHILNEFPVPPHCRGKWLVSIYRPLSRFSLP